MIVFTDNAALKEWCSDKIGDYVRASLGARKLVREKLFRKVCKELQDVLDRHEHLAPTPN